MIQVDSFAKSVKDGTTGAVRNWVCGPETDVAGDGVEQKPYPAQKKICTEADVAVVGKDRCRNGFSHKSGRSRRCCRSCCFSFDDGNIRAIYEDGALSIIWRDRAISNQIAL